MCYLFKYKYDIMMMSFDFLDESDSDRYYSLVTPNLNRLIVWSDFQNIDDNSDYITIFYSFHLTKYTISHPSI